MNATELKKMRIRFDSDDIIAVAIVVAKAPK